MKITRSSLLVTFLVVATPACGGNRLLVGDGPDGGPPTGTAGTTGAAGTGVSNQGTAGTAVATQGTAGTGDSTQGTAGTGYPTLVMPLKISGEEAIRRMVNVLWQTQPDEGDLANARKGHYATPEDLYQPFLQFLADPRAKKGLGAFYRWWLELDRLQDITKDPVLFPEFTPALAADMATEVQEFAHRVTMSATGNYEMLMTAPYTWATERLAAVYQKPGPTGNTTFQMIELPQDQRAGLLTQPALQVLSSFSKRPTPTGRGADILRKFLCKDVPEPPAGLPEPKPIPPSTTTRKWLEEEISVSASCVVCHSMLDPLGLPFESFDAIGRWRTTDNGAPVDTADIRLPTFQPPRTISSAVQLAKLLADNSDAQECMARQWLSYVLNRKLTTADNTEVAWATARWRTAVSYAPYTLRELIFAVLTSDAFLAP